MDSPFSPKSKVCGKSGDFQNGRRSRSKVVRRVWVSNRVPSFAGCGISERLPGVCPRMLHWFFYRFLNSYHEESAKRSREQLVPPASSDTKEAECSRRSTLYLNYSQGTRSRYDQASPNAVLRRKTVVWRTVLGFAQHTGVHRSVPALVTTDRVYFLMSWHGRV